MSASKVIDFLHKIVLLQASMNTIAKKKTEVVKRGDIDSLNTLIKDEQKHLHAYKKLEAEMLKASREFLDEKGQDKEPNLTSLIEAAEEREKEKLLQIKSKLEDYTDALIKQNALNQQLLEQSLHFVNLSLDLLLPSIDSFNYENPNQTNEYELNERSIFNSKA